MLNLLFYKLHLFRFFSAWQVNTHWFIVMRYMNDRTPLNQDCTKSFFAKGCDTKLFTHTGTPNSFWYTLPDFVMCFTTPEVVVFATSTTPIVGLWLVVSYMITSIFPERGSLVWGIISFGSRWYKAFKSAHRKVASFGTCRLFPYTVLERTIQYQWWFEPAKSMLKELALCIHGLEIDWGGLGVDMGQGRIRTVKCVSK